MLQQNWKLCNITQSSFSSKSMHALLSASFILERSSLNTRMYVHTEKPWIRERCLEKHLIRLLVLHLIRCSFFFFFFSFPTKMSFSVDFTQLFPLDLLLPIVLALPSARDVLNAAHVCVKLRRVFFERNAFAFWLRIHLPKMMGDDCLLLALVEEKNWTLVDPFEEPSLKADSLRPYIAWAFSARKESSASLFSRLDCRHRRSISWLSCTKFSVLLPPGTFPSLWVCRTPWLTEVKGDFVFVLVFFFFSRKKKTQKAQCCWLSCWSFDSQEQRSETASHELHHRCRR
jgi:hypothetical protein